MWTFVYYTPDLAHTLKTFRLVVEVSMMNQIPRPTWKFSLGGPNHFCSFFASASGAYLTAVTAGGIYISMCECLDNKTRCFVDKILPGVVREDGWGETRLGVTWTILCCLQSLNWSCWVEWTWPLLFLHLLFSSTYLYHLSELITLAWYLYD